MSFKFFLISLAAITALVIVVNYSYSKYRETVEELRIYYMENVNE